jgi:hypothetical protein
MKRKVRTEMEDDLRPEYDLRQLLKRGVRGKYLKRYRAGTNLVLLEPDVARAFSDEHAVNETLRLVIQLAKIRGEKNPKRVRRAG